MQIKVNVGICHRQHRGQNRSSKGQREMQHKAIGITRITAGQGNDTEDNMIEGRSSDSQRAQQKVEEGGRQVPERGGRQGKTRQDRARQARDWQC